MQAFKRHSWIGWDETIKHKGLDAYMPFKQMPLNASTIDHAFPSPTSVMVTELSEKKLLERMDDEMSDIPERCRAVVLDRVDVECGEGIGACTLEKS